MSKPYVMPSLGAGMEAGTVVEWHVEPGQKVARGDVIGLVDTEKGAIEIEVWEDAEVEEIVAPPGTKVPVGEPLLMLKEAEETAREEATVEVPPEEAPEEVPPEKAPEKAPGQRLATETPPPTGEGEPARIRVSPVARRRAAELGIDPSSLQGTGPAGAITLVDVERAAETEAKGSPLTAPSDDRAPEEQPQDDKAGEARHEAMRKAIAAAMSRSKREIPHYYLAHVLSMEPALRWLEEANRDRSPARRILLAALYLKAVATALPDYPEFNGFWEEDAFRPAEGIHPGLAISLRGGGLVAPAIHDVPERTLDDITAAIRDVVQRARAGRLRGSEVTDPSITVTSLGDRGVDTVFGVIYPPQVAIVGVGTVVERPWTEGGMVGSRRTVRLTLAADHRASDGHRGGLFLARVAHLLQTPEDL